MTATLPVTSKKPQKRKGNQYAHIHRNPLPLEVYPLPAFHPTQPLSLFRLIWSYCSQWIAPPQSKPAYRYLGYLSSDTKSVHIVDPATICALWEQGFFGKGSLSRSEPTWLDRERTRMAARSQGIRTAEEATRARREERRLFKLERARLEWEGIQSQRKLEQSSLKDEAMQAAEPLAEPAVNDQPADDILNATNVLIEPTDDILVENSNLISMTDELNAGIKGSTELLLEDNLTSEIQQKDPPSVEHLQLTLEEAFFLSYGLGVLGVRSADQASTADLPVDPSQLFAILARTSNIEASLAMDGQFILNYVVYHHFRSLGWVVRSGVKFSCDYLLYNRGPVFSHAEFAILIMPSYSDAFWQTEHGLSMRKLNDAKDWWWLHCINRVQSQVKKTLVLCYVDIPPPRTDFLEQHGVTAFLQQYKIREFIVRRWLMNRSRD